MWSLAITLPLVLRRVYPVAVMVTCSVVFYLLGSRVPLASGTVSVQAAPPQSPSRWSSTRWPSAR
jgi:hypothetical protein